MKKIIGTAVPLSALWSNNKQGYDIDGTTAVGELFIDWLESTGQHTWQLLPLSETHLEPGSKTRHVPSPYKGYGIGFDPAYLPNDFRAVAPTERQLAHFRQANKSWVESYALFVSLRDHFGTDDWSDWPKKYRDHDAAAIRAWISEHAAKVESVVVEQWQLDRAFKLLRAKAHRAGVLLVGDLPFYLPYRSPLVWANRDCFEILRSGKMSWVSGVPNGPKSHYGRQVWGHPLYRWSARGNTRKLLALWKMRIGFYGGFYDAMRLDHAKGFFNYGAMRVGKAEKDTIKHGPGRHVMCELISYAKSINLELFAEDSGDRLKELREVLNEFQVPGIRILRWAYNENRRKLEPEYSDVRNYPHNCYAFTHTHDTMTLKSYVKALSTAELKHLCEHVGVQYSRSADKMVDRLKGAVISSPAKRVLIPIQDWLYSEERINIPGTERKRNDQNWRYRCEVPVKKLPMIRL